MRTVGTVGMVRGRSWVAVGWVQQACGDCAGRRSICSWDDGPTFEAIGRGGGRKVVQDRRRPAVLPLRWEGLYEGANGPRDRFQMPSLD